MNSEKIKEDIILNKLEPDNSLNSSSVLRINNLVSVIDKNCMEGIRKSDLSNEEKIRQLLGIINILDGQPETADKKYVEYFKPLLVIIKYIDDTYICDYSITSLKDKCIQHISEIENEC